MVISGVNKGFIEEYNFSKRYPNCLVLGRRIETDLLIDDAVKTSRDDRKVMYAMLVILMSLAFANIWYFTSSLLTNNLLKAQTH